MLALYLVVQGSVVLATSHHAGHSVPGIIWTALTAVAMFCLAWGKVRTGKALDNVVLRTEGRVTLVDGILASAVLAGLALNAAFGWWWADPVSSSFTTPHESAPRFSAMAAQHELGHRRRSCLQ